MPTPWPHRVTFMPPLVHLPAGMEAHQPIAAHLLAAILDEHFLRHPLISSTDLVDLEMDDSDGRIIDVTHPRYQELVTRELVDNRRDEVLAVEAHLVPPVRVALYARRRDLLMDQFFGTGMATLSALLTSAIDQWLASRYLPRAPLALEGFTLHDFLACVQAAARVLQAAQQNPVEAAALLESQFALRVPFLRLVDAATDFTLDGHVLAREADNPRALLATKGAAPPVVARLAPQWGRLYLALGAAEPERALAHHAVAARLMPRNVQALDAYATSLRQAGRYEEAYRVARRASRLAPSFVPGHLHALHALQSCHRHGEAFLQAVSRSRLLADLWRQARAPSPAQDKTRRDFLVTVAHMTFDVGRLDDAVKAYREVIQQMPGAEAAGHKNILRKWETDPIVRATSFARDAHHRGDAGGTIYGYARGRVEEGADTARLVSALIDVGREDAAAVAWAVEQGARAHDTPMARLAGARALLLAGDFPRAYDEIQHVQLRYPQGKLESEVNRLLRLGSARPIYDWDAALRERMAAGQARLAQLAARDAADFFPGLERSAVWRAVAGATSIRPFVFDLAWLEGMKKAMGQNVLVDIDLFFHTRKDATLESADRLANDWPSLIAPRRASDPTADAQTLYVLAHALCRYLALTTQAPNVLAGGYRQVAADALAAAARAGVDWLAESVRPFLAALEQAAGCDPWIYDTWLLRVENSLDLDYTRDGTIRELAAGLKRVPEALRADERIAFELELAADLAREGAVEQARVWYERSMRATGSPEVAAAWSTQCTVLPPREALDAHSTAAAAAGSHPGPLIDLARALAGQGKGDLALDALTRIAAPLTGKPLAAALQALAPIWAELRIPLPFDPAQAIAQGDRELTQGTADGALRAFRWAVAATGGEAAAAQRLAMTAARAGRLYECAAACALIDRGKAAKLAARMLSEAKRFDLALPAARLAWLLSRTSEDENLMKQAAALAQVAEPEDPARQAWRAILDGDLTSARAYAASGQSWPLTRAALTAAAVRGDADAQFPVAAPARGQLTDLLSATVGQTDMDALLCRVDALKLREDAQWPVDPPTPLGPRVPRERLS